MPGRWNSWADGGDRSWGEPLQQSVKTCKHCCKVVKLPVWPVCTTTASAAGASQLCPRTASVPGGLLSSSLLMSGHSCCEMPWRDSHVHDMLVRPSQTSIRRQSHGKGSQCLIHLPGNRLRCPGRTCVPPAMAICAASAISSLAWQGSCSSPNPCCPFRSKMG